MWHMRAACTHQRGVDRTVLGAWLSRIHRDLSGARPQIWPCTHRPMNIGPLGCEFAGDESSTTLKTARRCANSQEVCKRRAAFTYQRGVDQTVCGAWVLWVHCDLSGHHPHICPCTHGPLENSRKGCHRCARSLHMSNMHTF